MICPVCNLPMSIFDDAIMAPDGDLWYCDGPNDNTSEAGCFNTLPVEVAR